jgi:hypothetical protein
MISQFCTFHIYKKEYYLAYFLAFLSYPRSCGEYRDLGGGGWGMGGGGGYSFPRSYISGNVCEGAVILYSALGEPAVQFHTCQDT